MATFRTKQFAELSFIIKTFTEVVEQYDNETVNNMVDNLVFHFALDNKLFNERMFREGCGKFVKQDCIIIPTVKIKKSAKQRMYNGRFI